MVEQEIELKLSLPEGEVARFRRDPMIHRLKQGRAVNKPLLAAYFDTPNLSLKSARMALRIRQEGRLRVQTLKIATKGSATGIQVRGEFNAKTNRNSPDIALIESEAARCALLKAIGRTKDDNSAPESTVLELIPVFTTDVRRTIWTLADGTDAVEVCLDLGTIESGGKSVLIREVELELKRGSEAFLLDIADTFSERYGCRVFSDSKAARGYGLFSPSTPTPRKAGKLRLEPDQSVWEAFQAIVGEGTDQLFANEPAVRLGQDVEGVHQARVAVRRMRAALSAFRSVLPDDYRIPLNKDLRWVGNMLGPARDWDVFIDETLHAVLKRSGRSPALDRFAERCGEARKRGYRRARKGLNSARYGRLQLSLIRVPYTAAPTLEAERPIGEFAGALLDERLRAVQTTAGRDPSLLDEVSLHALRIDIKKLRYAIEFFGNIYVADYVKPYRSALKRLQECLGGLNDAAVHTAMLQAMNAPDRPVSKSVQRAILSHLHASRDEGLSHLTEMWGAFSTLPPFWRS